MPSSYSVVPAMFSTVVMLLASLVSGTYAPLAATTSSSATLAAATVVALPRVARAKFSVLKSWKV